MKASVVVPVYNPGSSIERCIASVIDQSLPDDEYEVIFVDDGSTDDTPQRLDALAAGHPNIRVFHTPNSGWAGRPRNIGIDAAQGRFIQLLDQDDELTPEALERLVDMGDRNRSDIVIGRVASDFRRVSLGVFARSRERCSLADAPLIDSLTPHKMFRTAFLRANGLRFAEGRRRLEDQLFVVQAYFRTNAVSILADPVCYRYLRREDGGNSAKPPTDPAGYYDNLREVMDVVVANTRPGDFRDTLLRRFIRIEVLGRVSDRALASRAPEVQAKLFEAVRRIVTGFAGPGVEAGLEPLQQATLRVIRAGNLRGLIELSERTASIAAAAAIETAGWRGGMLELQIRCQLHDGKGRRLTVVPSGKGLLLDPELLDEVLDQPLDVTDAIGRARVIVWIRESATGDGLTLSSIANLSGAAGDDQARTDGARPLEFSVSASLDPLVAHAGAPVPPGRWVVMARVQVAGIDRRIRVQSAGDAGVPKDVVPAVLGQGPIVVRPTVVGSRTAVIDVHSGPAALAAVLGSLEVVFEPADGRSLDAVFRVATTPGTAGLPIVVVAQLPDRALRVPARLVGDPLGLRLHAVIPMAEGAGGAGALGLALTADGPTLLDLGAAKVTARGRIYPVDAPRAGARSRAARALARRVGRVRWQARSARERGAVTAGRYRATLRHGRSSRRRPWNAVLGWLLRSRPRR